MAPTPTLLLAMLGKIVHPTQRGRKTKRKEREAAIIIVLANESRRVIDSTTA
jgi:hypothetical protein